MFRLVLEGGGSTLNIRITVEIFDLCIYFLLHKKIYDRNTVVTLGTLYYIFFMII